MLLGVALQASLVRLRDYNAQCSETTIEKAIDDALQERTDPPISPPISRRATTPPSLAANTTFLSSSPSSSSRSPPSPTWPVPSSSRTSTTPGTVIAGTDVSLCTTSDAAERLRTASPAYTFEVTGEDFAWSYAPETIDDLIDVEAVARASSPKTRSSSGRHASSRPFFPRNPSKTPSIPPRRQTSAASRAASTKPRSKRSSALPSTHTTRAVPARSRPRGAYDAEARRLHARACARPARNSTATR